MNVNLSARRLPPKLRLRQKPVGLRSNVKVLAITTQVCSLSLASLNWSELRAGIYPSPLHSPVGRLLSSLSLCTFVLSCWGMRRGGRAKRNGRIEKHSRDICRAIY